MASQLVNGNKIRGSGSVNRLAAPPGATQALLQDNQNQQALMQNMPVPAAPPPGVNPPIVGAANVTAQNGPQRVAGDRTGIQVTSAGGTPIRIDNNRAIPGLASQKQIADAQIQNQNSKYYDAKKDPAVIAREKAAEAQRAADEAAKQDERYGEGGFFGAKRREAKMRKENDTPSPVDPNSGDVYQVGQNKVLKTVDGRYIDVTDPRNQYEVPTAMSRLDNTIAAIDSGSATRLGSSAQMSLPKAAPTGNVGTSASGLAPSTSPQAATPQQHNMLVSTGSSNIGTSSSGLSSLTQARHAEDAKLNSSNNTVTVSPKSDPTGSLHSVERSSNDVAKELGGKWTGAFVDYWKEQGGQFLDSNGDGRVDALLTPNGTLYDGSEITDAAGGADPENAAEGSHLYDEWKKEQDLVKQETKVEEQQGLSKEAYKQIQDELNKPLDLTAINKAFDEQLAAARQANARNKALALRSMQEGGARAGLSVNQMMGMQTEAGYAYDTQNRQQEAAINMAKEGTALQAQIDQNNKKIQLATMAWQKAADKEMQAESFLAMQQLQSANEEHQARLAGIQSAYSSPGIGMTLAKIGIGIGGAVAGFFSAGAGWAGAASAIAALGATAGSVAGDYGRSTPLTLRTPPGYGPSSSTPNLASSTDAESFWKGPNPYATGA